jgi:hypothetical protein
VRAVVGEVPDRDDALGVRVGQRFEQHWLDGAEDRGRRADAERQGEDADRRERRRAAQPSCGVAQIGQRRVHGVLPAVATYLFARGGHVAHIEQRGTARALG